MGKGALKPYYKAERIALYLGDCVDVIASLPDACIDSIVTDPPYELGFMGKAWDGKGIAYSAEMWKQALRVLKPGGHLLAFGGTRTYHRMACAIEDAGFDIRDSLMWLYGSGFPKSLDVSKAIDKTNGDKRPVIGKHAAPQSTRGKLATGNGWQESPDLTSAASAVSAAWEGWGTALKPAFEPIVLARKPLTGSVSQNVLKYGTSGLNIDGTRVDAKGRPHIESKAEPSVNTFGSGLNGSRSLGSFDLGRWPANVVLDEEAARQLGSASRFFYTSKTSRAEREYALGDLSSERRSDGREKDIENPRLRTSQRRNDHPTVKPTDLMRWLCRLITPPNGVVLDPFVGSGSTGAAAFQEGFRFVGIDLDAHYLEIAKRRIRQRVKPADMAKDVKATARKTSLVERGYKPLI